MRIFSPQRTVEQTYKALREPTSVQSSLKSAIRLNCICRDFWGKRRSNIHREENNNFGSGLVQVLGGDFNIQTEL